MTVLAGCEKERVNLTKEDCVVHYAARDYEKKNYKYYIDIYELISVRFEGPSGCGKVIVDTTELEKYVLNHTVYAEGSIEYEAIKTYIQEHFKATAVDMEYVKKSSDVQGYLTNKDVIKITFNGMTSFGVDNDGWLENCGVQIENDYTEKEFEVTGLKDLEEEHLWEGVGYKFNEAGTKIIMSVENEYSSLKYEWSVKDAYSIQNGDTFEITVSRNGEELGKKQFTVSGKAE